MDAQPLRSLIDWVQFTLPIIGYVTVEEHEDPLYPDSQLTRKKMPDLTHVYELLGMGPDQFTDVPHGMHFYRRQRACGHIKILYEGYTSSTNMTIHVHMSGQGCREYESFYNPGNWESFFAKVVRAGGTFTRVDLSIDDIRYHDARPYFTLAQIIRKVKRNECKSKFKNATRFETIHIEGGKSEGLTVYFGSNSSDIQIIFYEKNYERLKNKQKLEEGLTAWNRVEICMRDDRANAAIQNILDGVQISSVTLGVFAHYLDFLDRVPNDSNKSRWPRAKFWEDFLNAVQPLRLARSAPDKTIEQKQTWIDKQTLPTIAQLWYAFGCPGIDVFIEMLEKGMERMSEAQWAQAEIFRQQYEREKELLQKKKDDKRAELIDSGYFIRDVNPVEKESTIDFYKNMLQIIKSRLDAFEGD